MTVIHPRLDMGGHPMIGLLLQVGVAVRSQGMRAVGTDHAPVHEQALLDVAAGYAIPRGRQDRVVALGHSGGGTLQSFNGEWVRPARSHHVGLGEIKVMGPSDPIPRIAHE